ERRAGLSAEASWQALSHARRAGDRFELREIEEWLVIALVWGPTPAADAAHRCRTLLDDCGDDPARASVIVGALSHLGTMSGQLDEADRFVKEVRALQQSLGEGIWIVAFHLAEALLLQGDTAGAESELRMVYDDLKRIGDRSHFSAMAQLLAEAVYRQGR